MKREILTRGGSASSSSSSENEWAALSYQTHCAAGNASLSSTPNKTLQYLSLSLSFVFGTTDVRAAENKPNTVCSQQGGKVTMQKQQHCFHTCFIKPP